MTYTIDFSSDMALTLLPASDSADLIQQIYVLVNTVQGTIPCYRDFGVDSSYLHRPINVAKTMYASAIVSAIKQYVPGVSVESVNFANDTEAPSTLIPVLEVSINE